jgi:hypothetical protein
MENKPKINVPHFKGLIKQKRASGYTFKKCIYDIIDNIIGKSCVMYVKCNFNDDGKLLSIGFSDKYEKGFENLNESNEKNPFNLAHIREGHDNDDETSEFGIGFKAASINLGEKLIVYTYLKEKDKQYLIELDFNKMMDVKDPVKSYELTSMNEISKEIYIEKHGYNEGSTLIIENIRDSIIKNCDMNSLKDELSETYSRTGLKIYVNDEIIPNNIDYFKKPECKPFNKLSYIYYNFTNDEHLIKIDKKYYE